MDNRITSEDVAQQFAKAIKLLLEWVDARDTSDATSRKPDDTYHPSRLLKIDEVAGILSISQAHVYQLVQKGEITSVRIGKSIRVRMEDLDHFISTARR